MLSIFLKKRNNLITLSITLSNTTIINKVLLFYFILFKYLSNTSSNKNLKNDFR